jgi:TonB family protein
METLAAAVDYPETARRDGQEGVVHLRVAVDDSGHVREILVARPVRADLDSAAVQAVRAITWEAAQGAGRTLPCQVEVPVRFKLDGRPKP